MGNNWNISIQGVGAHHNDNLPLDADKLARKFVQELKEAGHEIEHAEFTYGGKDAVDELEKRRYGRG